MYSCEQGEKGTIPLKLSESFSSKFFKKSLLSNLWILLKETPFVKHNMVA